jgi:2-phosphoglycerate kinase
MTERRHREPLPLGGDGLPYSKGLMARALIATGLSAEDAYELARRVESDLTARQQESAALDRIEEIAAELLGDEAGRDAIRRLRRYSDVQELDLPILLLVGGATGTGKSTVATEAAYRLGITRVTSTDFVRQTMRAFFSAEFMPSVHHSSFEAGKALPASVEEEAHDRVIAGFLDQTRNVLVGVEAAIDRALEEGWSMVLEGVHLVPGLLPPIEGALVVQCLLAIANEETHASHFWIREATSEGVRPLEKYLEGFAAIRVLQEYLIERADRTGVPVIENTNVEHAIAGVMELVFAAADRAQAVEQ